MSGVHMLFYRVLRLKSIKLEQISVRARIYRHTNGKFIYHTHTQCYKNKQQRTEKHIAIVKIEGVSCGIIRCFYTPIYIVCNVVLNAAHWAQRCPTPYKLSLDLSAASSSYAVCARARFWILPFITTKPSDRWSMVFAGPVKNKIDKRSQIEGKKIVDCKRALNCIAFNGCWLWRVGQFWSFDIYISSEMYILWACVRLEFKCFFHWLLFCGIVIVGRCAIVGAHTSACQMYRF